MAKYVDVEKEFCADCEDRDRCGSPDVFCDVHSMPAADVAPVVHGKWEKTSDGAARCTACKRKMNPSQYGYAFCGLCGAKMDGERN